MKTIIAGTRTFTNYELMEQEIEKLGINIDEVVCGCAKGVDTLGKRWADERGIPVKQFPPDWNKYGKVAGIIRNHEMGDYADYLIAFWDGKSRGTKDMIEYMKSIGKHGSVIIIKE